MYSHCPFGQPKFVIGFDSLVRSATTETENVCTKSTHKTECNMEIQDITWKTHNGGKNHDNPQAVKIHYMREEYNDKESTEATTSCLLLHHTRRRLHSGGNDLSLSLSLSRSVQLFYNYFYNTTIMCPKSYLYIHDFSAYLHLCPSNRFGTDRGRFCDEPVLCIFHPEGYVSQHSVYALCQLHEVYVDEK